MKAIPNRVILFIIEPPSKAVVVEGEVEAEDEAEFEVEGPRGEAGVGARGAVGSETRGESREGGEIGWKAEGEDVVEEGSAGLANFAGLGGNLGGPSV